MNYFLVIGTGPQAPEPIEHVATTAIEAEAHRSRLQRLCGRAGKVEVWSKDGRKITLERLAGLVRAEQATLATSETNTPSEGCA